MTPRNILGKVFETLLVTFASAHFGYLLDLGNIIKVQTLNEMNQSMHGVLKVK